MTAPMNHHAIKSLKHWRTAMWFCPLCQQSGTWLVHIVPSARSGELLHEIDSPGCKGEIRITVIGEGEEAT